MKLKFFTVVLFISSTFILVSCGAGKKLDKANAEITQLQTTNSQLNQKLSANEAEIGQLKKENIAYGKEAQDCREVKQAIENNLRDLNNALASQGTSLRQIKEKAEASLEKIDASGADVEYKKGLLHISMNDKLLFKSGSAVLSAEGVNALSVIAEVLNEYPKLKTYVVGNTDDAPVRSGFKDNWSLSTERANAIVRVLRDKYQVDPSRLVAGGMGKYNPVADNSTEEGRALNRRTEIILNPDLSRLWEYSESMK